MGLYTPTILGGNSYLSWFYDRGAIKDRAHTGTSKGLSQAINRGPIRKFWPKYANIYVTIQSHSLSAGARTHYVTANGVRNGLQPASPLNLLTTTVVATGSTLRGITLMRVPIQLTKTAESKGVFGRKLVANYSLLYNKSGIYKLGEMK